MTDTYFNLNFELDRHQVLENIDDSIAAGRVEYICVADANVLQRVHNDKAYRDVVNGAMFSICDSSWIPIFLKRIHGIDIQTYCGSQIFEDIVSSCKYRMCFLGTRKLTLDALKHNLCEQMNPDCASMPFVELPFCKVEDFDYQSIANLVQSSGAEIVWVALGAPKQEFFASKLKPFLTKGVIIPVGAVFKFYSGISEKRAPKWVRKHHLEFLYRILQDPRKQIHRCRNIARTLPSILREEKKKRL